MFYQFSAEFFFNNFKQLFFFLLIVLMVGIVISWRLARLAERKEQLEALLELRREP